MLPEQTPPKSTALAAAEIPARDDALAVEVDAVPAAAVLGVVSCPTAVVPEGFTLVLEEGLETVVLPVSCETETLTGL